MTDRVSVTINEHVACVTLNRPDKFNAVDTGMFDGLIAAGESLAGNDDVRAVVLRGEGEHFCAGIDLGIFQAGDSVLGPDHMSPMNGSDANYFQRAAIVWRELPVPVIAALHGICYGAGLQIALGADVRVASPDTMLSVMEVKWGIVPDMGLTVTARGLVRPDRLKELALSGRVIDGQEAAELGLVTEVADAPLDAATRLARDIASRSPDATAGIKALLNGGLDADPASALALEAKLQLSIIGQPNQVEAVRANMEKRDPEFAPRRGA